MSDIIITSENLGRFNKRLQKSLKKQFNQEVPLHVASTLFANALGVDGEFQLKKNLEAPVVANKNISAPYDLKAKNLINELTDYFKNNPTKLSSVSLTYIYKDLAISIVSQSVKFDDEEGFGLYFGDNPSTYLEKELSIIEHSVEDKKFLKYICNTYFTADTAENLFLGSRLSKMYNLDYENNTTLGIYRKN